jgi:hypothetical protein
MDDVGDGSVRACLAYGARMHEHGGLTWGEWVADLAAANGVSDLSEFDIDELLWEHTAWPVAGIEYIRQQLLELFANQKEKSCGR